MFQDGQLVADGAYVAGSEQFAEIGIWDVVDSASFDVTSMLRRCDRAKWPNRTSPALGPFILDLEVPLLSPPFSICHRCAPQIPEGRSTTYLH